MKKLFHIFIVIFLFSLQGCSFLDEEPTSLITDANYYKTESDAIAATNAIYDFLSIGTDYLWSEGFGGVFFNDFWVLQELCSDNATTTLSSPDYQQLSDFQFNASNQRFENLWKDMYQVINCCNTVIDRVPECDMDDDKLQHLIAEAHFWRGAMYFELVRLFGDVPYLDKATTSLENAYPIRTENEEIYTHILADLDFAESNLLTTYREGLGRPQPLTAKALKARILLTRGVNSGDNDDLLEAADLADQVISSGNYILWDDYADIFKIANAHSGEIILGINFSGTLSQGFKGNQFLVRLLPPGLDLNNEGPTNAHGWEVPTTNLVAAFADHDRRKDVTFISSYTYSSGHTEYFEPHFAKWWDAEAEPRGNESNADYIYIRLAEMYLIKAEALNEANNGPTQQAYDAINTIRERARFDGTNTYDILPDLEGLSYEDFRMAVLDERQREFAIEGHRWYDLTRFNQLKQKVEDSDKENATPGANHNLFPIPQRERELNTNLTQNQGY